MGEIPTTRMAKLKLYVEANGRLKQSILVLNDEGDDEARGIINALIAKKDRLLRNVRAKIPLSMDGQLYIPLHLKTVWDAESWKLDAGEEIAGLGIRLVDQNDHKLEVSRNHFRTPQYL